MEVAQMPYLLPRAQKKWEACRRNTHFAAAAAFEDRPCHWTLISWVYNI